MSPPIPPPLLLDQLEAATSIVIGREPTKGSLPTIFPTSRDFQKITFGVVFACQNGCLCVLSNTLSARVEYFQSGVDATGRQSLSALQKCLVPSDNLLLFDEYLHVGESTGILCLIIFATAFVLLSARNSFGHPPPKIVNAPMIDFTVNGNACHMSYYLADGIYPRWSTFVKTFSNLQDTRQILFRERQESARKDVERAFGVLQGRFNVVKAPSRLWYVKNIADIMYTGIILHNMIIADEGPRAANLNDEDEAGSSTARSPPRQGVHTTVNERIDTRHTMRDTRTHIELQKDLIKHIWMKFGNE
ncbi:uncharacterized protein LOC125206429 [Salvia hispanica]|uniref:uncharacterized protein LOC125206429 n=1 Tax=Salvia hispanica TaxID=49212 RepID=UPI002009120D|nr:uncharacterized protein LOC125206429 [Salvia hispanica]